MRIPNKSSDASKIHKQKRTENSTGLETFLHTFGNNLFLNSTEQKLGLCQVFFLCICRSRLYQILSLAKHRLASIESGLFIDISVLNWHIILPFFFPIGLQQKINIWLIFFSSKINEDVGWCKLSTPDGLQQLIQISHPGVYER